MIAYSLLDQCDATLNLLTTVHVCRMAISHINTKKLYSKPDLPEKKINKKNPPTTSI